MCALLFSSFNGLGDSVDSFASHCAHCLRRAGSSFHHQTDKEVEDRCYGFDFLALLLVEFCCIGPLSSDSVSLCRIAGLPDLSKFCFRICDRRPGHARFFEYDQDCHVAQEGRGAYSGGCAKKLSFNPF